MRIFSREVWINRLLHEELSTYKTLERWPDIWTIYTRSWHEIDLFVMKTSMDKVILCPNPIWPNRCKHSESGFITQVLNLGAVSLVRSQTRKLVWNGKEGKASIHHFIIRRVLFFFSLRENKIGLERRKVSVHRSE